MLSSQLEGKIFLTGGTGTFGKAILDRAHREKWDCTFTIYSRDEIKQAQLRPLYPEYQFVLGDVRDLSWMTHCMRGHDIVIHAAAYKIIDSAEHNVAEVVKTNAMGSLNVAQAAIATNVSHAICLSSDKACMPINLYGATKMAMERVFQQANNRDVTTFHLVRYGNIIGSRGSVVPLFRRQAKESGLLTITDRRMTRFWHTIDEGIELVLRSLQLPPGTILIPKAKAMKVVDLANVVAPNAETVEIGIRPGEKLHETLVCRTESVRTQDLGNSYVIHPYYTGFCLSPVEFEYTSDTAPQYTKDEMRALCEKYT